ncbi:hypothetical protein M9H77_36275 [Catharanthus roseus]|uniref:Uncharacterized protein n=1 Tax=Catharanthus roseus TaxID=4058 RepID=A0ACB9ZRQ6_CATRO|nr:hypothetical protein M9H77_36275 [Catharanthus roseus]
MKGAFVPTVLVMTVTVMQWKVEFVTIIDKSYRIDRVESNPLARLERSSQFSLTTGKDLASVLEPVIDQATGETKAKISCSQPVVVKQARIGSLAEDDALNILSPICSKKQYSQCEERTQEHPHGIANLVLDWTPLLDQFVTAFFANKILFVWSEIMSQSSDIRVVIGSKIEIKHGCLSCKVPSSASGNDEKKMKMDENKAKTMKREAIGKSVTPTARGRLTYHYLRDVEEQEMTFPIFMDDEDDTALEPEESTFQQFQEPLPNASEVEESKKDECLP